MNLDYTHRIQDPMVERQDLEESLRKPRIHWSKGNLKATWKSLDQELSFIIRTDLNVPIRQQIVFVFVFLYIFL